MRGPSHTMSSSTMPTSTGRRTGPKPLVGHERSTAQMIVLKTFLLIPFVALVAAIPFAWGWGLTWVDLALAAVSYTIGTLGVTVGYHRYFTQGAFKTTRPLRVALALARSMAVQGSVLFWVASQRPHRAFADKAGDPHSPSLFRTSPLAR